MTSSYIEERENRLRNISKEETLKAEKRALIAKQKRIEAEKKRILEEENLIENELKLEPLLLCRSRRFLGRTYNIYFTIT